MCLIYELIWLDDSMNDSFDFPYYDREFGEVIRAACLGLCYRFALSCCRFELVVARSFWVSSTSTWEFWMGCNVRAPSTLAWGLQRCYQYHPRWHTRSQRCCWFQVVSNCPVTAGSACRRACYELRRINGSGSKLPWALDSVKLNRQVVTMMSIPPMNLGTE